MSTTEMTSRNKRTYLCRLLAAVGGGRLVMEILRQITRVHINETLDTRTAVIKFRFANGKEYSLWTTGQIEQRKRRVAIMQPIGEMLPYFPNGWPEETTSTLDATVRSISPY